MNKFNNFNGQPVISQVLKFITRSVISPASYEFLFNNFELAAGTI